MGILFCSKFGISEYLWYTGFITHIIFLSMRHFIILSLIGSLILSSLWISGAFADLSWTGWELEAQRAEQARQELAKRAVEDSYNAYEMKRNDTHAADIVTQKAQDALDWNGPITVITTAEIPGASCTCKDTVNSCNKVETRKYECIVQPGMTSFQKIIGSIIKWFVFIIMLLGVLAIVGAGIMMAFGSDSEEYTKKAKGWAMNIIIGLIILFTFSYILKLIAPWIYQ